jgi:hypothetical protein
MYSKIMDPYPVFQGDFGKLLLEARKYFEKFPMDEKGEVDRQKIISQLFKHVREHYDCMERWRMGLKDVAEVEGSSILSIDYLNTQE